MSEVENENKLEEVTRESRNEDLKAKVFLQRKKVCELLEESSRVNNSIYAILLAISNDHRIENIDDVCDFMDEIDKKYGLILRGESDFSRLYREIYNEQHRESIEIYNAMLAQAGHEEEKEEFINSDEDMFNNPNITPEELERCVRERLELYKSLIHNMELSNYEHKLLLARIQELQRQYDEYASREDTSHIRHPRIEDYEI